MMHFHTRVRAIAALIVIASLLAGCAAGRAFGRGNAAARDGDWDAAVEHYRRAVQENPGRADYRIALERAMVSGSQYYLEQAKILEARGNFEEALRAYRRASDLYPPNRQIAARVVELERQMRDQAEAARPRGVQQLREAARQAGPPPLFNLTTELSGIRFTNTSLRDILTSIAMSTGINVTYDNQFQDRTYTVQMDNVTLEEALQQILTANQLFYKVINPRTIVVIPDNPNKRAQYEEQVIQTFHISHADATELAQMINTVIRVGGGQVAPMVAANKTANTITIRATTNVAAIIERIINANDKPRAEVVVDVQILEVQRSRAKQFGIELSQYAVSTVFSPEVDPRGTADGAPTLIPQPINAESLRGIVRSDFYLSVPAAIVRFLETDSQTKVVANPQLRGAEGQRLTLNLGEDIPVPSTTFSPVAAGGAAFQPLTSFTYRAVGVNVEMTPRVTFEGDIQLELVVESSTLGRDIDIAGQNLPSFGARRVATALRLREGEATLLAGLLREDERRSLRGFPGILRLPVIRQLFSANEQSIQQTDIIMLLTPRIVRTHELTPDDVSPIYIGTQQNLGLGGGPPPLIAQPAAAPPAEPVAGGQAPAAEPGGVATAQQQAQPPGSPQPVFDAGGLAPLAPVPTPGAIAPVGASGGQVIVSVPEAEFRVGGGPYTVPLSISGASRLSSVSLTVSYNPAVLRVRNVQEGSFMRSGNVQAAFTQRVDPVSGRVDIAVVRTGDSAGVAGTGLLAALLFDALGPGPANLTVTGTAVAPGGSPLELQFMPIPAVAVR
jgi:general secretion pathway protein D